jgi:hypothetical protein
VRGDDGEIKNRCTDEACLKGEAPEGSEAHVDFDKLAICRLNTAGNETKGKEAVTLRRKK